METSIDASKATTSKKRNRSKWDNNCRLSSEMSSNTLCDSTLSQISQIDIGQFCSKNLFYIFIVNESDDKSASLLSNLIDINKRYEELSCITFISRDDVLDFGRTSTDYIYPNHLKPLLLSVIENTHNSQGDMTINAECQILKLKLIQVMYSQYAVKVKENDKQRTLESFLNVLAKECKKKQKTHETFSKEEDKNRYQGKDESKKKLGKGFNDVNKNEKMDYTGVPLNNDGISYERNIFDYVGFYCFHGFYNADIIQNLLEQVGVPVSGIIKIIDQNDKPRTSESNGSSDVGLFWHQIEQFFFGNTTPYKYLQNTILLRFCTSELYNSLVVLEEFVTMLRKVLNVKLTHLNYIQHLKVHKMQHSYEVIQINCLKKYNKYLRNLPAECINPQLVLSGLLNEVCFAMESNVSDKSSLSNIFFSKQSKPSKSFYCLDLMSDTNAITSKQQSRPQVSLINANDDKHSFLVHDDNMLLKVLKTYKYTGAKSANDTLKLMTRIPILSDLDYLNNILDIVHSHDINPSRNQIARIDLVDNLMYIFLFSKMIKDINISDLKPVQVTLSNLWTFDLNQQWKDVQLRFDNEISAYFDKNFYDTSIVHFNWKENLSKEVLIQKVFAASDKFLYAHKKYSPESDNYFVVFSDKLDDFGINIKIIDVLVRTPVCIRDFCIYLVVDESRWVKNNRIYLNEHTFKPSFQENCPGVRKVKTQQNMFEEYSYLLNENLNEDNTYDLQTGSSEPHLLYNQKSEMSFSNILNNLEKCSPHMNLMEETQISDGDEHMLAYDLGSNIFKVVGKVTTFHSHDSVKVTIDNTKLLQAPDQCTFTVTSAESTLILHSSQSLLSQPFLGTLILNDNTRISFSVPEERKIECKEGINTLAENPVDIRDGENEIGNIIYDNDTSHVGTDAASGEQLVHYVDADFITMLLEGKSLEALSANEVTADLLVSVIKAKENNGMIYKVNNQSSYLKRRNSNIKLPLGDALRNIVSLGAFGSPRQKALEVFAASCRSNQGKHSNLDIKTSIDFRICLPNGLYIRPHLSVIDKKNIMIKQEYAVHKPNVLSIQQEEFRLFSNQGLVVIKKVDGTMSILKANGDIFHFEKLNGGFEENSQINACHCSTIDDYRNKLNKLLKDNSNYPSSRKGHITSRQRHILDNKILNVLKEFNVPFLKKSITKFDGKRIKVEGNKITQKQVYHLTSEHDFFTGEISFERSDDFRCMFYKNGSQMITFPDGTLISTCIDVPDELVDDFVYVKLSYQYEHSYYVKIKFNFDETSEIILNNDVAIKNFFDMDCLEVNMNHGLSLCLSKENLYFRNTCASCSGKLDIDFNLNPFKYGCWSPHSEFMYVKDTYNKELHSDFVGNCFRNSDYIKSDLNAMKCNHVKESQYKQLFVINKDLTGEMLSTNDFVECQSNEIKYLPNGSVNTYNRVANENVTIVDCRKKYFVRYSERFYNYTTEKLPSYYGKSSSHQSHFYTTFRTFQKMFQSVDEFASHVSKMRQIFFNDFPHKLEDLSMYKTIVDLGNALEVYFKQNQREMPKEEAEVAALIEDLNRTRNENAKCSCIKENLTMDEKIHRWKQECTKYRSEIRQIRIPIYFKSEFCKIIK